MVRVIIVTFLTHNLCDIKRDALQINIKSRFEFGNFYIFLGRVRLDFHLLSVTVSAEFIVNRFTLMAPVEPL